MARIFPFRATRPRAQLAPQVAAVPYDVVTRAEAHALADGNPLSFLHVTKPEIDLPAELDPSDERVYAGGAAALERMRADGTLRRDDTEHLFAYQLQMGQHVQTGVVLCASVQDYDLNIVRKHEHTRPAKEDDRVRHMKALGAQSGTVFLAHKPSPDITGVLTAVTAGAPWVDFRAPDGVVHRVWEIAEADPITALVEAFDRLGSIYIADGHHRSAAASRVAAERRQGAAPNLSAAHERFLAVSFSADEVQILPYNRVVSDLQGSSPELFLEALKKRFAVTDGHIAPSRRQIGMFLDGRWYHLDPRDTPATSSDPTAGLDVSLLQNEVLGPLLGIQDPRTDPRIDFVGGIRGDAELEKRVRGGAAVAFSLHATTTDELFAIADAEQVMPPKSTWFEPKLRDGLFIHEMAL